GTGPRLAATGGGAMRAVAPATRPATAPAEATLSIPSFVDLVALAGARRDLKIKHALETVVRVVRFEDGHLEFALTEHAPAGLVGELGRRLEEWTGRRWMVVIACEADVPTIAEDRQADHARMVDDARAHPLVAAVLSRF